MASYNYHPFVLFVVDSTNATLKTNNRGEYELDHGQVYKICVGNNDFTRRSDVIVNVDGHSIGSFRLNKGEILKIEGPPDAKSNFTFYGFDTDEARRTNVYADKSNAMGLISAQFYSERVEKYEDRHGARSLSCISSSGRPKTSEYQSDGLYSHDECDGVSSGGTGLSSRNDQRWKDVQDIKREEVIKLTCKLVLKNPPIRALF